VLPDSDPADCRFKTQVHPLNYEVVIIDNRRLNSRSPL
jgi:hypothetical protein